VVAFLSAAALLSAMAVVGVWVAAADGGTTTRSPSGATAAGSGKTVHVLYAGSLEAVMNDSIAPAFQRATGYTFNGFPAGSKELASEIRGRVEQGDVFISASSAVDATLRGRRNGSWVSWYAPFASTRLVLGYNPSSAFAGAIRAKPWYRVIVEPNFRLGFTDPTLDPKGVLAVQALDKAAARYNEPALRALASDRSDFFPEQDLVGRLQSGQLDAGFFYTVEASAARMPTVSLGPIRETAIFTITVLRRAPELAGAESFVRFLLSRRGVRLLAKAGLARRPPVATGHGVPPALRAVIER
jgi:molybdate/tungstate transport system substrate-binding protein